MRSVKIVVGAVTDLAVSIRRRIRSIYASNHKNSVHIIIRRHGVLFIHQGFVDLRRKLCHCLSAETTIIHIGYIIRCSAITGIIQVCHVIIASDLIGVIRNLSHITDKQHVCRCRICWCSCIVQPLKICFDRCGCGTNCSLISISLNYGESFFCFPLNKWLQSCFEHTIGNNYIFDRIFSNDIFGPGCNKIGQIIIEGCM
ncbi:hypothetical protein DSECCO2_586890 [anaerobic digester metagenome]